MQALQYRIKVQSKNREWSEWQWLPGELSFSGVKWDSVYFEFRWWPYEPLVPGFTKGGE